MPLPGKKLRLVESSTTGRKRTRWIKPKIDDNQNRESNACKTSNSVAPNDDYPKEVGLGLEVSVDETNEDASTASKERKTKTYEEIKKKM